MSSSSRHDAEQQAALAYFESSQKWYLKEKVGYLEARLLQIRLHREMIRQNPEIVSDDVLREARKNEATAPKYEFPEYTAILQHALSRIIDKPKSLAASCRLAQLSELGLTERLTHAHS